MTERLLRLIETLGSPRILVAGEIILDRYVWGEVERVSPEAPIPVLRVTSREERLGGAGCVVSNLVTLGARVACCSVVGSDRNGEVLKAELARIGVDAEGLQVEEGRQTVVKTRMIGFVQSANRATQHIMRMDEEKIEPLREQTRAAVLSYLRDNCSSFDAVLISDYDKGMITGDMIEAVVKNAGKGNIPIVADPRRSDDYSLYRGVTALMPNRYEASLATGIECGTPEGLEKAGEKLLEQTGAREVAITIDKDGIYLCRKGETGRHFPIRASNAYDVTGAGDMVLSAYGLALAAGALAEDAAAFANVAAGVEVTKLGAAPVSKHELFEAAASDHISAQGRIRERREIRAIADAHRSAGETVVFTNGCFDILHPGHIRYLQFARSHGDVLIIGLNSDESVRKLKGKGRPIMSEGDRATILGALESVTHVVLFDEETPRELVEEVRPDVLVKGEDWREKGVVGREFVESYGGQVVLADIVEGYSTSSVIEKIRSIEGRD